MPLVRPVSAPIAQHHQQTDNLAPARITKLSARSNFLGRTIPARASASAVKPSRAARTQISCQASPYSLDPSIASFQYQPVELSTSLVQSYDFLVLGSGIAGLTYALKVCFATDIFQQLTSYSRSVMIRQYDL